MAAIDHTRTAAGRIAASDAAGGRRLVAGSAATTLTGRHVTSRSPPS
ncbi:hypothetical protein ACU686_03575 [Yinghuangia aomiensis]